MAAPITGAGTSRTPSALPEGDPLEPVPALEGVPGELAAPADPAPAGCPLPVQPATVRSTATVTGAAALPHRSRCRIL